MVFLLFISKVCYPMRVPYFMKMGYTNIQIKKMRYIGGRILRVKVQVRGSKEYIFHLEGLGSCSRRGPFNFGFQTKVQLKAKNPDSFKTTTMTNNYLISN